MTTINLKEFDFTKEEDRLRFQEQSGSSYEIIELANQVALDIIKVFAFGLVALAIGLAVGPFISFVISPFTLVLSVMSVIFGFLAGLFPHGDQPRAHRFAVLIFLGALFAGDSAYPLLVTSSLFLVSSGLGLLTKIIGDCRICKGKAP